MVASVHGSVARSRRRCSRSHRVIVADQIDQVVLRRRVILGDRVGARWDVEEDLRATVIERERGIRHVDVVGEAKARATGRISHLVDDDRTELLVGVGALVDRTEVGRIVDGELQPAAAGVSQPSCSHLGDW